MELTKAELEMLSDCILCKMKEISSIKPSTEALSLAIQSELDELKYLNSVVSDELSKLQKQTKNTEH